MKLKRFVAFICLGLMLFSLVACDDITNEHPDDVVHTDTPPEKHAYPVDIGLQSCDKGQSTIGKERDILYP